jgi:hypothetical protein
MRVLDIRQELATFCRRLLIGGAMNLRERNDVIQVVSRAPKSQQAPSNSETSVGTREVQQQAIVAPSQQRPEPENNKVKANEIVNRILGGSMAARVSNILVIQNEACGPLKRMEIHMECAEQATAMLEPLVSALRDSGFDLQVKPTHSVPANDIWLVSPLNGDKTISVYSRALQTEEVVSAVTLEPRRHGIRLGDWVTQSSIANAIGGRGDGVQSHAQPSPSAFAQGGQERANS